MRRRWRPQRRPQRRQPPRQLRQCREPAQNERGGGRRRARAGRRGRRRRRPRPRRGGRQDARSRVRVGGHTGADTPPPAAGPAGRGCQGRPSRRPRRRRRLPRAPRGGIRGRGGMTCWGCLLFRCLKSPSKELHTRLGKGSHRGSVRKD